MRKTLQLLAIIILEFGCTNQQNELVGKWQQYTTAVNGDLQVGDEGYNVYFIINRFNEELTIVADYDGKYKRDTCDNVLFDGKELVFRKHNKDGSFNSYKLDYNKQSKLLVGQKKSWNGNTYDVKYKKIN